MMSRGASLVCNIIFVNVSFNFAQVYSSSRSLEG